MAGWFLYQILAGLPTRDQLRELRETAEGTTLYDARDRPVFTIPTTYRVEIALSHISPFLQKAIVAVEDVRFYEHDGIDAVRLIGALITDLRQRRAAEGASTITQQLARMSFLTRDKTLRRKGREAILGGREPILTCAIHSVDYLPYPEPYFAALPVDDLGERFGATAEPSMFPPAVAPASMLPSLLPSPVPASAPPPPLPPRRLPDLPAAPPDAPPEPLTPQNPAAALPPPAAPEPPPQSAP